MNSTSETCMSCTGLFIHFVILLRVDQPYMATMVYRGIFLVYQIYTTAQGFDVAHAKWYICVYIYVYTKSHILALFSSLPSIIAKDRMQKFAVLLYFAPSSEILILITC